MILAMDTATSEMTVALVQNDTVVAEYSETVDRSHSAALLPAIDRVLKTAGTEVADLRAIAVGRGPGSYTGVRIAVTVAKTLAWSAELPLVGVSSLRILAGSANHSANWDEASWVVPLIDARRGHAYTALFEAASGEIKRHEPDLKRPVKAWAEQLAERAVEAGRTLVFVGETERFLDELSPLSADNGGPIHLVNVAMNARVAALYARDQIESAGGVEAVHAFVPDYTQPAEVEIKFMNKGF